MVVDGMAALPTSSSCATAPRKRQRPRIPTTLTWPLLAECCETAGPSDYVIKVLTGRSDDAVGIVVLLVQRAFKKIGRGDVERIPAPNLRHPRRCVVAMFWWWISSPIGLHAAGVSLLSAQGISCTK